MIVGIALHVDIHAIHVTREHVFWRWGWGWGYGWEAKSEVCELAEDPRSTVVPSPGVERDDRAFEDVVFYPCLVVVREQRR